MVVRGNQLPSLTPNRSLTVSHSSPQEWKGRDVMGKVVVLQCLCWNCRSWQCGLVERTALGLRQISFQVQASTHYLWDEAKSAISLRLFFICNMGTAMFPLGILQRLHEKRCARASFDSRRTMMISKASFLFAVISCHSAFTHLIPFAHLAPATVASLLNFFYTPSLPLPRWLYSCHGHSLECFFPQTSLWHILLFLVSAQVPLSGRVFLMTLSKIATPTQHPPALYHITLLYFLHIPSCYLKCHHVCIYWLVCCVFFYTP